jgi:hypothetical protein
MVSLTSIRNPSLWVIINPGLRSQIAVDPTLIRVEADGRSVLPRSIRYHQGKSATAPSLTAQGPIDTNADYLTIHLPLDTNGALNVVTHLPPIIIDGQANQFPDVSFKLEKHTRLFMMAGNC